MGSRCPSPFLAVSRTVDPRTHASSITGVTAMKVIGRDREVRGRLISNRLFARRSNEPGRLPLACDWPAIVTADLPVDSPVLGDRTSLLEVTLPQRASVWPLPHPRSKALLYTASKPRNLSRSCALSILGGQRRERLTVLRRGGVPSVVDRKGFDSQRAGGYSPLDFPSSPVVLGFLETERVGGAVCSASFGVEHESGENRIRRVKFLKRWRQKWRRRESRCRR